MKNVEDYRVELHKITNASFEEADNIMAEYGEQGIELYCELAKQGKSFEEFKDVYKAIESCGWHCKDAIINLLYANNHFYKNVHTLTKMSKEIDNKRAKLKKELLIKYLSLCLIALDVFMIGAVIITLLQIDPMIAIGVICVTAGVSGLLVNNKRGA